MLTGGHYVKYFKQVNIEKTQILTQESHMKSYTVFLTTLSMIAFGGSLKANSGNFFKVCPVNPPMTINVQGKKITVREAACNGQPQYKVKLESNSDDASLFVYSASNEGDLREFQSFATLGHSRYRFTGNDKTIIDFNKNRTCNINRTSPNSDNYRGKISCIFYKK